MYSPGVAGYTFEVQVFGFGTPYMPFRPAISTTLRGFTLTPFDIHSGLQAHDPTTYTSPKRDGLALVSYLTLPPATANRIVAAIRNELDAATAKSGGTQPVILASPQVRQWIRRLVETALPRAAVLGYNEVVRGIEVRTHGMAAIPLEAEVTSKK